LTKLHEEFRHGTLTELASYYREAEPRGEVTLLVAGSPDRASPTTQPADVAGRAAELLAEGLSRRAAAQRLVADLGVSRNEAYRIVTSLP
jgi:16S rRNA (cytidine1402-2'-O)-methyltransferase